MSRLSIRQVEIVEAIARHRSVSRAAQELNLTQSAISHALAVIENSLSVQLFRRQKLGVEPTRFVDPFLNHAPLIRDIVAATKRELDDVTKPKSWSLRIRCGLRASFIWVMPAILILSKNQADCRFESITDLDDLQHHIESGETELAVASLDLIKMTPDMFAEFVGFVENRFVVRKGHPLSDSDDVRIEDLRHYPLVGDYVPREHAEFVEGQPGRLGILDPDLGILKAAITIKSTHDVIDMIEQSDGVARLPRDITGPALDAGRIVELKTTTIMPKPMKIYAIGKRSALTLPTIQSFLTAMHDVDKMRQIQ